MRAPAAVGSVVHADGQRQEATGQNTTGSVYCNVQIEYSAYRLLLSSDWHAEHDGTLNTTEHRWLVQLWAPVTSFFPSRNKNGLVHEISAHSKDYPVVYINPRPFAMGCLTRSQVQRQHIGPPDIPKLQSIPSYASAATDSYQENLEKCIQRPKLSCDL